MTILDVLNWTCFTNERRSSKTSSGELAELTARNPPSGDKLPSFTSYPVNRNIILATGYSSPHYSLLELGLVGLALFPRVGAEWAHHPFSPID